MPNHGCMAYAINQTLEPMLLRRRGARILVLAAAIGAAGALTPAWSLELQHETIDAWQQHLRGSETRMQARLDPGKPFLWIDEAPDRAARIRQGDIVVQPATGNGLEDVPHGLIHDWIGGVFIPNATITEVFNVLDDHDSYKDIYKPAVADSRVLASTASGQEFTMTWRRRVLFVSAAMQGWYRSNEFEVSPTRRYSVAESTRIQQIERYGHGSERYLPPDTGDGFIWRIQSIVRYEQRDGGVYLEIEAIALTRDIPASLEWMVSPVVRRLSMNSLTATLEQTRTAVETARTKTVRLAKRETKQQN